MRRPALLIERASVELKRLLCAEFGLLRELAYALGRVSPQA